MKTLKKLVGKTVLAATAALTITAAFGGNTSSSACPSGHYLCKARSSWFGSTIKCCPPTHNCCPSITCLDANQKVIQRISESCIMLPTPCPSC